MGIGSQRTDVRKKNKIDFNKWTLFGSGFKEKKNYKNVYDIYESRNLNN